MDSVVTQYFAAYRDLLWHFNCRQEYYIKGMIGYNWEIIYDDETFFLEYWQGAGRRARCLVVLQGEWPLIYLEKDYAMVVAIDCVKLGFVLETRLNKTDFDEMYRRIYRG
ncbi:MAG: hypothetical protein FWF44_05535 [Defluviitaleaceae bacterium]|nr:hypothetical protein [Defluviitaleaceae bacterium]